MAIERRKIAQCLKEPVWHEEQCETGEEIDAACCAQNVLGAARRGEKLFHALFTFTYSERAAATVAANISRQAGVYIRRLSQ